MNNFKNTPIYKNFIINILNPLRKTRPKEGNGSYNDKTNEEYMSILNYQLGFKRGDFIAMNLDWIYYSNKANVVMLVEQKSNGAVLTENKKMLLSYIDDAMSRLEYVTYLGFYTLRFEHNAFEDGWVCLEQMFVDKPNIIHFDTFDDYKNWMKKTFKQ